MNQFEITFTGGAAAPGAVETVAEIAEIAVNLIDAIDKAQAAAANQDKLLATKQAEFALAGIELVRLADGTLLASQGGWFRPLRDLDEATTWLARVTGRAR